MDVALIFICLFGLLALTVPIGVCLGLAATVTLVVTTTISPNLIAQNAFAALDSFTLLAIPFFVLAGCLMQYGGISRRLLDLANSLVGHLMGGLAMVTTVTCMFFAAISGSGPATVSAIGTTMIPEMVRKGYSSGFSCAINACAGSIGVIIPPSIPFVIYAVATGCSISDMFIAGVVPGICVGLGLMGTSYLMAKRNGWKGSEEKPQIKKIGKAFKDAIWALFVPVIILGGIYAGVFSPTEAAVAGVVYAFFVGLVIYRELNWKTIYASLLEGALISGTVVFMIGLSTSFAQILTMKQVPAALGDFFFSVSESLIVIMLLINLLLLIIGCVLDNISATIVLAPILLPIVMKMGMDPVHFGVIMTLNLSIGFVTPPYGINLFVASNIGGERIEKIAKAAIPLLITMIITLMCITFIPEISLALVNLLK
ncbi:MAG: TRAP transporter large permease [Bacillota bacterium]|jgi:C4-dicarboxylate transporter DctM subunit